VIEEEEIMTEYKTPIIIFVLIVLSILIFSSVKASGNDFVSVDLRTDTPEVLSSLDYQVWLASEGRPNGNYPTFTSAWLSIDLDNQPGLFGHKFSQVGVITDSQGIYWFVYAETGEQFERKLYLLE
jgi:hypothetical protein